MKADIETEAGMDEKLRALLDQMPQKPPRSKLEPHLDVIRELRRRGRTYQEIAKFFSDHLQVPVAASTIHAFIRVRASRRQRSPQIELPAATSTLEIQTASAPAGTNVVSEAGLKERMEALKRRRPQEKVEKPRFEYNENELLRLVPGNREEG